MPLRFSAGYAGVSCVPPVPDSATAPSADHAGRIRLFSPDDLVVYPAQGVGKIERIDHQEVGGAVCEFYIVRIMANNVTLMVPVRNAANVGLRRLTTPEHARDILDHLTDAADGSVYTGQNWNRRFREYSEKLKSQDLADVAQVMRELMLIGRSKDLSFGERRLLEQATALVTGEISEVLSTPEQKLREHIQTLYASPHDTPAED